MKSVLVVGMVAAVAAGAGFWAGTRGKAHALDACGRQIVELQREREEAQSARGTQISSALAIASRGLAQARQEATPRRDEAAAAPSASGKNAPDGGMADRSPLATMLELKSEGARALEQMQRAVRLSSDQRATLDRVAQAMNIAVGDAVERLAGLDRSKGLNSKDFVPVALDVLQAVKKADDAFREGLDVEQRRALDDNGFDILSQVDPLVFLRIMTKSKE